MADDYQEWIEEICASRDACSIRVKIADNEDNRSPFRLGQLDRETARSLKKRYARAREALEEAYKEFRHGPRAG